MLTAPAPAIDEPDEAQAPSAQAAVADLEADAAVTALEAARPELDAIDSYVRTTTYRPVPHLRLAPTQRGPARGPGYGLESAPPLPDPRAFGAYKMTKSPQRSFRAARPGPPAAPAGCPLTTWTPSPPSLAPCSSAERPSIVLVSW